MLRTADLIHPASTQASRPTSGVSLPGTLASPRTGLAPAGPRELGAQVRQVIWISPSFLAPELLGAHLEHSSHLWIQGTLLHRARVRRPYVRTEAVPLVYRVTG
jgi:hypothetical protein